MSDHIGDATNMVCVHCGMPSTRKQNGIQGYRCGSSYCEAFRPQWARSMTCLEIQNGQLQERVKRLEEHIAELEKRLTALWDKYYSDANYYEKRMCQLIEAGNSMYEFINPPTSCMRTTRIDNLLQGWDDAKIGKEARP